MALRCIYMCRCVAAAFEHSFVLLPTFFSNGFCTDAKMQVLVHVFDGVTKEPLCLLPHSSSTCRDEATTLPLSCFLFLSLRLLCMLVCSPNDVLLLLLHEAVKSRRDGARLGLVDMAEARNLPSQRSTRKATALGQGTGSAERKGWQEGQRNTKNERNRPVGLSIFHANNFNTSNKEEHIRE